MTATPHTSHHRKARALGAFLACAALTATAAPAAVAAPAPAEAASPGHRTHGCVVVHLDLGETLVHTDEQEKTGYMEGAESYLRSLRKHHIQVGLITNVPSEWGNTDAERAETLRREIDSTWTGSSRFAWSDFGDRVLTPRTEQERKPAPALFERAKEQSGGCKVVYQEELDAAEALGFETYLVHQPSRPAYLPVEKIEELRDCPHGGNSPVAE